MTFISENYGVYGVWKMWRVLQRQGIDIGREHKAQLMRSAGLSGKGQRWGTCHNA
ncbi:transposase [Corynebacterium diphtheriae bv. gravis]|uniref:IS3 family transposase n=1 Tax=Corynebacterium diphtheriae TaxID=1717 RepID=UPI0018CAF404|nr:transposase [Corynebacterium diphtheriae bv. gravis]MBG9373993.1 transposase [Corynebacterium diphtheriae bv. gravis]